MPARSKSQQRLFGMVHAYQKGKLKDAPEEVKEIARSISEEDAEHFAKTKHKGLPEKKAYERGFMGKMAEYGMPKLAGMEGMTKLKYIRQAVNKIISARAVEKGGVLPERTVGHIVDTTLGDHILRMKPTGITKTTHGPKFTPDLVASSLRSSGFPKRPVYRAEVMPDVSSVVGATASSHVINEGANLRHITPNPGLPFDFGNTPILMYNGRKVPGLFSGTLGFYNNNGAELMTHGFRFPENIFSRWTRRYRGTPAEFMQERHTIGRARRQVLDVTTKGDYYERSRFNPRGMMGDESLIDTNKITPSRVIAYDPSGNAIDITNLYAYATAQKRVLPNNFNLGKLLIGDKSVLDGLTNAERKAAERYRAVHDIITHSTGATGKGFVT